VRDFREVLELLRTSMLSEYGPYVKRRTCRLYAAWVRLAGGGWREPSDDAARQEQKRLDLMERMPLVPEAGVPRAAVPAGRPADWFDEIWPLHLIDVTEKEQFERLYVLRVFPRRCSFRRTSCRRRGRSWAARRCFAAGSASAARRATCCRSSLAAATTRRATTAACWRR
jgi:hypothetical protein